MDWEFLKWVLERKGFGNRLIRWIMGCLGNPHFSIMLNGVLKRFFGSSRDLWEGDPLSTFLFTLVMDAFSALMSNTMEHSLIDDFPIGRTEVSISHLQFADDTIYFINDEAQVQNLKYIF